MSFGNEFHTGTTLTENNYFLVLDLNLGRISLRVWPRVVLFVFNSNISCGSSNPSEPTSFTSG